MESKTELRRRLRRARAALDPVQRHHAQKRANQALKPLIKRGKRIGAYWAAGSELDVHDFIVTAQQRGARVYLPYIAPRGKRLWFTPYPQANARPERTRARLPRIPQFTGRKIRAERLQLLLLPLVGIDRNGTRLGQGGGFYDATLSTFARSGCAPRSVGVGFACQICPPMPAQTHDQRVQGFVCERGYTRLAAGKHPSYPFP
ncbi:5-formyltetrahydrofolate cyclo-ligase [Conchiformibius steedae]|uniref:5-formyltetrahydrofolate cyclo-ligase n=1 Tax=Conchiformibius steedae TaxID=153493 RepID=A0A3P2A724_9NEIS|nr:5-formyltetrahydrofolate cyclo-ligase [Conchiformibius steedae]RRD91217.1 5-formyltetrahydrofolate cyclo-ligase [Conchiformibius steedae]